MKYFLIIVFIYYKGHLIYSDIALNIDQAAADCKLMQKFVTIKRIIKTYLFTVQCSGTDEEWLNENFKLYNIPGLRQSARLANNI